MDIHVRIIPNDQHREGITGADWYFDNAGNLEVRISQMSDTRYEAALAIHEIVEAVLCRFAGVTVQEVDEFDKKWEAEHPQSKIEAGDQPDAPYQRQHGLATAAERIVAAELKILWRRYDEELESL